MDPRRSMAHSSDYYWPILNPKKPTNLQQIREFVKNEKRKKRKNRKAQKAAKKKNRH